MRKMQAAWPRNAARTIDVPANQDFLNDDSFRYPFPHYLVKAV